MNEALGLHARPSKPLLWKLGGYPRLPPSEYLYSLACQLRELCLEATLDPSQESVAPGAIKRLLLSSIETAADDQSMECGIAAANGDMDHDTDREVPDEVAASMAAKLAADVELRRALQEGTALFQLAVSRAAGQLGSVPMLGRLGGDAADPSAAAASIVASLQREIGARVLQVDILKCCLSFAAALPCIPWNLSSLSPVRLGTGNSLAFHKMSI